MKDEKSISLAFSVTCRYQINKINMNQTLIFKFDIFAENLYENLVRPKNYHLDDTSFSHKKLIELKEKLRSSRPELISDGYWYSSQSGRHLQGESSNNAAVEFTPGKAPSYNGLFSTTQVTLSIPQVGIVPGNVEEELH